MNLTTAQLQTLKADFLADGTLSTKPNNGDGNQAIADAYNVVVPTYFVFATSVPVTSILDQITWANYTPADAVPTTTVLAVAIWQARCDSLRNKQNNLNLLLVGRAVFDASKIKQRTGINDATQNLASGAGGALQSGGWSTILPILRRPATRLEKLFAVATTGVGTDGIPGNLGLSTNPALMVVEGAITGDDILNARNS